MKQKTKVKFIFWLSALLLLLTSFSSSVLAADGDCPSKANYDLEINLPFIKSPVCGPAAYLSGLYQLAVGVAVALAVVIIVYAGIIYASSGDNASKQKEAKTQITQAIFGLAILLASFLILNTINPDLVNLGLIQSRIQGKAGEINLSPPPNAEIPSEFCKYCLSGASESYDKCIERALNNSKNSSSANYLTMKEECETKKDACLRAYNCYAAGGGGGGGGGGGDAD